ncbi:metastasis-suppressor KiSS-1 [Amia ocellicauda]|uniref:metastasis-suppressor KiSS-1 n=1 Tax=Amia ocellicauda TaxID=2972642 RepID=UPI003464529B
MLLLLLPLITLMVTAQPGQARSERPQAHQAIASGHRRDLTVQDVLRELGTMSPPGLSSTQSPASRETPSALARLLFGAGLSRRGWQAHERTQPPAEKREKNLSSYNWNSFGLRYGKRQTAHLAPHGDGASDCTD